MKKLMALFMIGALVSCSVLVGIPKLAGDQVTLIADAKFSSELPAEVYAQYSCDAEAKKLGLLVQNGLEKLIPKESGDQKFAQAGLRELCLFAAEGIDRLVPIVPEFKCSLALGIKSAKPFVISACSKI